MKKAFLLTGGAGYVGSHVLSLMREHGYPCVVLDSLAKGHREATGDATLIRGDLGDRAVLEKLFSECEFEAVLHFAGFIEAGESVSEPAKYFLNNAVNGLSLLEVMKHYRVNKLVFSSSAAVYGECKTIPIPEEAEKLPTNPYGLTKWTFEQLLHAYRIAHGIESISLRYFNAAGAHPSGLIGEDHEPETHLIPLALKAALQTGEKTNVRSLTIFGTDYPTEDGTCIRDYVHVMDLAEAHLLGLEALLQKRRQMTQGGYNLGSEHGYSVKEVITCCKAVTGIDFPVVEGRRRPGDPAILVASSKKARQELGWKPSRNSLREIVASAWNWHKSHRDGYRTGLCEQKHSQA